MKSFVYKKFLHFVGLVFIHNLFMPVVYASSPEDIQALKLFQHLTAVDPNVAEMEELKAKIREVGLEGAAQWIVGTQPSFYSSIVKNYAEPWSQQDGNPGSALNDTILTIIYLVRNDHDLRRMLYDDILAMGVGTPTEPGSDQIRLPSGDEVERFYRGKNKHYKELADKRLFLHEGNVELVSQVPVLHKEKISVAGILSTRGFGLEAYTAGTNRRAIPMIYREGMCLDLEDIRDGTASEKYILKDVLYKDPDGSVTTFKNECSTCHAHMDAILPAFGHYDVSGNAVAYERHEPFQPNNKMLKIVNSFGFAPKFDQWFANYTEPQKKALGWPEQIKSGFGLKSLGEAFSQTAAFARCQPKRAFKATCFRDPGPNDEDFMRKLILDFRTNGFNLKQTFIQSAIYCAGGQS